MSRRSWNYASGLSSVLKVMGSHGGFSEGNDKIRFAFEKILFAAEYWKMDFREMSLKAARPVKRLLK